MMGNLVITESNSDNLVFHNFWHPHIPCQSTTPYFRSNSHMVHNEITLRVTDIDAGVVAIGNFYLGNVSKIRARGGCQVWGHFHLNICARRRLGVERAPVSRYKDIQSIDRKSVV